MKPFFNPNKRSISLPNGCKDLADVLAGNSTPLDSDSGYIDLSTVKFTSELQGCIPAGFARKHHVLPIHVSSSSLCIALADPSIDDLGAIFDLLHPSWLDLEVRIANSRQLDEFIQRLYGGCET